MDLKDGRIVDWLQLIFTMIAGIYALYLYRESNRAKRRLYLDNILKMFWDDEYVRTTLYAVDKGQTEQICFGGELEMQVDKTLHWFDYLGFLIQEKELRYSDLKPFSYEIQRILQNADVEEYIRWLREHSIHLTHLNHLNRV